MTKAYLSPERGIKSWNEAERPREKLLQQGPAALSLAELLGILINAGHREATAVDLARALLAAVDYDLNALARWQAKDYQQAGIKGIGQARAVTLVAALELNRRRQQQAVQPLASLLQSGDSYAYLRGFLADLDHEEFWVICLNQANRPLGRQRISMGGITGTVVDARLVFRYALQTRGCVSLILAHNHPSGRLKPSKADQELTKKLVRGAQDLDLSILDHLIISHQGYYSFADEGML